MNIIEVFCDGGSRGNPGRAGIGIVISQKSKIKNQNDKEEIKNMIEISKYIGVATNNQAEYKAVIEALKYLTQNFTNQELEAHFNLDSLLVVEQLNGNYKLKNEGLKPLFWEIRELIIKLGGKVTFTHVLRDKNSEADKLVNYAIDNAINKNPSETKI
jgi:ribonuclease HI